MARVYAFILLNSRFRGNDNLSVKSIHVVLPYGIRYLLANQADIYFTHLKLGNVQAACLFRPVPNRLHRSPSPLTELWNACNITSMMTAIDTVRKTALALSISERAALVHDLILSLDDPVDFELGEAREREIRRRVQMVKDGKAHAQPSKELFREIEAMYP